MEYHRKHTSKEVKGVLLYRVSRKSKSPIFNGGTIEISQNYLRPLPENLILSAEWIYIINFSVATLNMLPIIMFDGERIIEALIEKIAKEDKLKKIMQIAISAYFFVLLGANIAFSMVR